MILMEVVIGTATANDGCIRLWDVSTQTTITSIQPNESSGILCSYLSEHESASSEAVAVEGMWQISLSLSLSAKQ
jgi:WD40 repeat protein